MMLLATIAATIATVVIHELGHASAASMLRLPWVPVLSRRGVAMKIGADGSTLTRRELAIVAAGGPAANLLLAATAFQLGIGILVLLNIFALLNLLPFRRFDGGLILRGQRAPDQG